MLVLHCAALCAVYSLSRRTSGLCLAMVAVCRRCLTQNRYPHCEVLHLLSVCPRLFLSLYLPLRVCFFGRRERGQRYCNKPAGMRVLQCLVVKRFRGRGATRIRAKKVPPTPQAGLVRFFSPTSILSRPQFSSFLSSLPSRSSPCVVIGVVRSSIPRDTLNGSPFVGFHASCLAPSKVYTVKKR